MSNSPHPITQLERITDQLSDPAVTHLDIYQQARTILNDVHYSRHPYVFKFDRVNRAASKEKESWFNFSGGRPDVDRLKHPPKGVAGIGRCNWPGESMFYCSTENGVPVFEVRAQFKDTLVISSWELNDNVQSLRSFNDGRVIMSAPRVKMPIEIYGLAIGVQRIVDAAAPNSFERNLLLKDDLFKASTPKIFKEIDTFIGDLFVKTTNELPNLYMFTSAISRAILHDMYNARSRNNIDGLLYPSVESRFTGNNIVLKPEFVDSKLRLCGAAMYKVYTYNEKRSSYSLKPTKGLGRHPENHSAVWLNIDPKHDDERFILSHQTPTVPFSEDNLLTFEPYYYKHPSGLTIP